MRSVLTTLLAALTVTTVAPSFAAAPRLHLEPDTFQLKDGSRLSVQRGRLYVPEDRSDPKSRLIDIGFVRFPSTNPNPGAPIVYLAGGPGGSGIAAARGARQPIFLALRQVADVIALDQRGTGVSNHIPPCTATRRLDPAIGLNEAALTTYHRETLQNCQQQWRSAGVAVAGYTTVQNADDLEDLRRALGAQKLNLWGISYGTHLAMATMRRHPTSIGRVALASVEGMDQTVKLPAAVDAAFARIGTVAGVPLTSLMRRVHEQFDANPQQFTARAADGKTVTFLADSFPLRMMAGVLGKNPENVPDLLSAYAALAAGQSAALAPMVYDHFYGRPLTMSGMPELMDVASGVTDARLAAVQSQAPGSLLGFAINFPMPQLRRALSGLDLGDRYRREVRARHPVLLLSGDLDVRTPLEEQTVATAGLRNLRQILVRNGGHDLFEAHPAVPGLLVDFFAGRQVASRVLSLPPPTVPANLRNLTSQAPSSKTP